MAINDGLFKVCKVKLRRGVVREKERSLFKYVIVGIALAAYENFVKVTEIFIALATARLPKITYFTLYLLHKKPFTTWPIPYAKKKNVETIPHSA